MLAAEPLRLPCAYGGQALRTLFYRPMNPCYLESLGQHSDAPTSDRRPKALLVSASHRDVPNDTRPRSQPVSDQSDSSFAAWCDRDHVQSSPELSTCLIRSVSSAGPTRPSFSVLRAKARSFSRPAASRNGAPLPKGS
jgi:hypothetical protein